MNSRLPKEPPVGPELGAVATVGAPPTSTLALDAGAAGAGARASVGAVSSAGTVTTGAEGVIGGSSSGKAPKPLVKQDLWHIEDRLLTNASKTNGAYRPFAGALRDAFAVADPEAMARVKAMARERCPSLDEKELNAFMRENISRLILTHVPRVVPSTPILVPRVENVIDSFKEVRDGVTGKLCSFLSNFADRIN